MNQLTTMRLKKAPALGKELANDAGELEEAFGELETNLSPNLRQARKVNELEIIV